METIYFAADSELTKQIMASSSEGIHYKNTRYLIDISELTILYNYYYTINVNLNTYL